MRNIGFHRIRVGDVVVTALCDGELYVPLSQLVGAEPDEIEVLRRNAFRTGEPMITVTAFAVTLGETTVLIDAGGSPRLDAGLGGVGEALRAAGLRAEQISAVLLTHLHGDHYGGLLDADGEAAYPRASLVIPAADRAYRLDPPNAATLTGAKLASVESARRAVAPYRDRTRLLDSGEALPGLAAVPLPGHTPGHMGWRISSRGESLLIWGDVVHFPDIQLPRPDIGMIFDFDRARAVETRERILELSARERCLIAGMHLDFPCLGRIAVDGAGYRFAPERFRPAI